MPQIPFRRVECLERCGFLKKPFILSVEVLAYLTICIVNLVRSKEAAISYVICADKFKDGAEGKGNTLLIYS